MITVRDGTPIHLRFAERVCGAAPGLKDIAARKGAVVRLVVTRDLHLRNSIVIAKGALAQARVERVLPAKPDARRHPYDPVIPGVSLQLDWVTTVTGDRTPIRLSRKGPAKAADLFVELSKSGADVRRMPISKGVFGFLWRSESVLGFAPSPLSHERPQDICIPDGARMLAYLDGELNLAASEVAGAQATLPTPNPDATLYVFRLNDKKKEAAPSPTLFCNRIEVGALSPQQMAIANLPPGNYSCRIGDQPAVEIGLGAGLEYYAELHRSRHDRWELWWFTPEVGEDLSAETQLVPPKPVASAQQ